MTKNINMEIWEALGITDPKHAKPFKRPGGFSGTAIKPMYAIQKMTDKFGACGMGWGYTKPEYQIVNGTEGQALVYCTLGLWYLRDNDIKSEIVWGVGGDFIIIKQSKGVRSDDEAFKKSMTDALMSAMKHIGMSADVYMDQFDASKYHQGEQVVEKLSPERVDFYKKQIGLADTKEKLEGIKDSAKRECEHVDDVDSYNDIFAELKQRAKQIKGEQI